MIAELIHTPDIPALPGLVFRHFAGVSDYPKMIAVINAAKVPDGIERADTVDDLANLYSHLDNCDLAQDFVAAEVNGEFIGYARVWWEQEDDGTRRYIQVGCLHPAWRRRGIGRALLRWAEGRLRAIAAAHPNDGQRVFQIWLENRDAQIGKATLLESEGYEPVRFGYMMTRSLEDDIPAAALPEGLEVCPVPPEHYRAVFNALDEAFRDHWGHRPATDANFQEWTGSTIFNPGLWQVAWDGEQVAGMVLNYIDPNENKEYNRLRGWTDPIGVRRPWRRRGLARALILRSLTLLKEQGMTEAALGVDTQNPNGALRLYESCGFRPVRQSVTYRKPLE
jgi:ribosomal protein S18 acetylase RimI-like enzyme